MLLFLLFIMFNLLPFGTCNCCMYCMDESICHRLCATLHLNYCQESALHLRPLSCLCDKSAWQKPQRRTCLWKKNFQGTISLENFPQRSWRSLKWSQIQKQPFPNKAAVVWNTHCQFFWGFFLLSPLVILLVSLSDTNEENKFWRTIIHLNFKLLWRANNKWDTQVSETLLKRENCSSFRVFKNRTRWQVD